MVSSSKTDSLTWGLFLTSLGQLSGFAGQVKTLKADCASEVRRWGELEESIRAMKREQERLSYARDEALGKLQHALREISVMEDRAQEVKRRQEEVAREMRSAQSSVVNLKLHRYQVRHESVEAAHWRSLHGPSICDGFTGLAPFDLKEFSMSEIESGTCNFSDSFRIGQGGSGCVYKGELLGKTVVVKQLHHHDVQGQLEFHKKVHKSFTSTDQEAEKKKLSSLTFFYYI